MRFLSLFFLFIGCTQSTKTQCMAMNGKSELVTDAKLLRLDIYPDSIMCVDGDVPPGSVPILSHTFKPGEEVKLDVPPGKRTLVLVTFADDAGTVITGMGCTTANLTPGGQVCINLTIAPAPDLAVLADLTVIDNSMCSGSDCPCSTNPDNCPAGQWCDPQGMCEVGCKVNSDCVGMGPANDGGLPRTQCNTSLHQCVECLGSGDCALGKLCSPSGFCVTGCDSTHACPGALMCCNNLCVDTTVDINNCGGCNAACAPGTPVCCSSQCVNLSTSADNCGSCGVPCSATGVATRHCAAGKCAPDCAFGKADCNQASNTNDGCETDTTTPTNCGACAVKCDTTVTQNQSPPTCRFIPDGGAATCQYTCRAPFADCDTAAPDTKGCNVNTDSDTTNCGACNNVCNTTNNSGTGCNGGSCTGTCNTNRANCDSDTHNLNECEVLANTLTNCGTNSCTPCLSGGIITTPACTPGAAGASNFCSYTCDNTKCPNTGASAHTCDGVKCSYTCTSGNVDCNGATAPDTDGCECPTATTASQGTVNGCCSGNSCQVQHDTGLSSEHFYDCTPRNTFTATEATAACIAHTGAANKCFAFSCPGEGDVSVICDSSCVTGCPACNCWAYQDGPSPSPGDIGHVNTACLCTSSSDPQWH